MPLMKDMPSSGAFLRSSVHPVQVGLGASPGRANSFANAPSKTPLRSTNRNHPIDLPDSSCFCHRPATVGSAACMGSVALVNATRLATSSIDNRVFNGVTPVLDQRRDGLRNSLNNMPISGRRRAIPIGFADPAPRIGAIRPGSRKNLAPCRDLASFSTVERLAVGPIASQLSFFFSEHEALFCRAREAIMRSALMAALDTSEPSSPSLFER